MRPQRAVQLLLALLFLGACTPSSAWIPTEEFRVATLSGDENISFPALDIQTYGRFEIADGCVVVVSVHVAPRVRLPVFPEGAEAVVDDDGSAAVRLADDTIIEMGIDYPLMNGQDGTVDDLYGDAQPECTGGNGDAVYIHGVRES